MGRLRGAFKRRNFELILEFAINDFKLKYRNTTFGYVWSVIQPLSMLLALYVVFTFVMKLNVPFYQIFLLIGIIVWNFFSEATTKSLYSLEANRNLLKKHSVHPAIMIISSCLSSLISLLPGIFILFLMMLMFGIKLELMSLFFILHLVLLFLFTIGISLIVSAIYLFFKDITHIWSFISLIGFWISPIIYPETTIPPAFRKFYMINPLARVISHLRNIFIYDYLDSGEQILISIMICLGVLFFGLYVFDRASHNFGDRL